MLRQLASDVNLSEEEELRRLEGGRPGWSAGAAAEWDAELDAELEIEAAIADEEEPLLLISEDEEYTAPAPPPSAAPAHHRPPASFGGGPREASAPAPPAHHRPALKPLGAAHAPRPQPAVKALRCLKGGAVPSLTTHAAENMTTAAARPVPFARGAGGGRAEVETFSGLRLAGGRALGDQALRALFEERGCRVLSLANVRAHSSAAGGWATLGMLVRNGAARSAEGGQHPTHRVWMLSDLDPDVPTLIRLEIHEEAAEAFPAAEEGQVYVVLHPSPRQGAGLSFTVREAGQLRLVGEGLDWRCCKAREHSGCSTIVDGHRVDYCPRHRREASQAPSSSRLDLAGSVAPPPPPKRFATEKHRRHGATALAAAAAPRPTSLGGASASVPMASRLGGGNPNPNP